MKPTLNIGVSFALAALPLLLTAASTNTSDNVSDRTRSDPKNAKEFFDRGLVYSRKGDMDKAISDFSEVIRLDPTNAFAYACRGGANYAKGDWDESIEDWGQAIRVDPANSQFYCNRALSYRAAGDFSLAIEDLNQCLRLNPTNASAYGIRAFLKSSRGDFDQAIEDSAEALRLNPDDPNARIVRAHSFRRKGEIGKALVDIREAIRLRPTEGEGFNALAWLRATYPDASARDGKEAVEAATKACKLSRWKVWQYIDTLAAAFAEAGDFQKAIKYEKQAMEMNEDEADTKKMEERVKLYEQQRPYREK